MTLLSSTDDELLRLTAQGDERAFATFVERHAGGVYRWALALTNSEADAEDVMQDTFVSAWRGAAGYRGEGEGRARAWLLTIAKHAWLRAESKRNTHYFVSADEESLDVLGARAGWGSATADGDNVRVERVREAFASLDAKDRMLLTLRDVEGWSSDAVARELGASVAAVKSRLHRARLRLAAAYLKGGDDALAR